MDRQAGRLDRNLNAAGPLQVQHQDERLGHVASQRDQTVVTQDERARRRPEVGDQPAALVRIERDALEVVIDHALVELQRPLVARLQPTRQRRHRHARHRVRMQHACRVVPRRMHGAVDGEAGRVHVERRVVEDAAFEVDLDERRSRDVPEKHAERVDQKLVFGARHPRRDVGVDAVVHAVVRDQAVGGGEVFADLAFCGGDIFR